MILLCYQKIPKSWQLFHFESKSPLFYGFHKNLYCLFSKKLKEFLNIINSKHKIGILRALLVKPICLEFCAQI